MTLETIYYLTQIIAVVAILGSLIFVGVQVRLVRAQTQQANDLAREETSRTNLLTIITEQQRLFATAEDAAFMHKAMFTAQPLTNEEKSRFGFNMALIFGLVEVGLNTHQSGLFRDIDNARVVDTLRIVYLPPLRVRKWWASARRAYSKNPDFVALIDKLIAEIEEQQPRAETL